MAIHALAAAPTVSIQTAETLPANNAPAAISEPDDAETFDLDFINDETVGDYTDGSLETTILDEDEIGALFSFHSRSYRFINVCGNPILLNQRPVEFRPITPEYGAFGKTDFLN